ncbi:MAG: cation acetate symporter, partial [Planctomycetota bacterium]|nr:cation acetate symporter [Planctomycetota bacterium]
MIYDVSPMAIVVFLLFVGFTLGLSFWLGQKAKSSDGYFAAHGQIPWFVNGVAFAGDYLSAASFLGICGMIAFYGYDGFLYSIGFLAGWIVALFVVAEPMKKLGKYTFADALDAKFNSRGIKLAAGISTLVVSIFYLIPQMVGAGVLIQPLLGFPHWAGVLIVGAVVITIVVTAGMVSTTYVQFLKGGLLVVFSTILAILILNRGFNTESDFQSISIAKDKIETAFTGDEKYLANDGPWKDKLSDNGLPYVRSQNQAGRIRVWKQVPENPNNNHAYLVHLHECQLVEKRDGLEFYNGLPKGIGEGKGSLRPVGNLSTLPDGKTETGPLNAVSFFSTLQESEVVLWRKDDSFPGLKAGNSITVYYPKRVQGSQVLRPGEHPKFKGIRSDSWLDKFNFISLMLALFCGTASLPHILIRYYTVKDAPSARK